MPITAGSALRVAHRSGASVAAASSSAASAQSLRRGVLQSSRDPNLREGYAQLAVAAIPRLLGSIDRNPYRATYGCLDRQFWHYRTASFPSEMFQEGVLPLALVAARAFPGNRWRADLGEDGDRPGETCVRELAIAAMRFSAASCHRDGSCDDYYPFERALGAAAFSFVAATEAYRLLQLDDGGLLHWLRLRASWLMRHDESGRLANHHALVALGLARLGAITGEAAYQQAAADRIRRLLDWQSDEGWFEEYGGADPGYLTVTIDCLAKYRKLVGAVRGDTTRTDSDLDNAIARAVAFARHFLHPDDSYAGEYGSRGTCHFYPHGMELLADRDAAANELADGFLRAIAAGKHAWFDDDRLYVHRLGNLIEAYLDWSPTAAGPSRGGELASFFPEAKLYSRRTAARHTIISAARGGVFKHFADGRPPTTDTGLIVAFTDGRLAVSQSHDRTRPVDYEAIGENGGRLTVGGPLRYVTFPTATPITQAIFHAGMWVIGRWCRRAVRRLLQRKLIAQRQEAPIVLTRRIEIADAGSPGPSLRVVDTIRLIRRGDVVARLGYTTDLQSSYVAATGVYQDSVLQRWVDLTAGQVERLNRERTLTVVREFA